MKFSSVSLIAATLAAIAGGAIAAPRPLHSRALEPVNSISERDVSRESGLTLREVDGEFVDNLVIRTGDPYQYHTRARAAAEGPGKAALAHDEAKTARIKARQGATQAAKAARVAAWQAGVGAEHWAENTNERNNFLHGKTYYSQMETYHIQDEDHHTEWIDYHTKEGEIQRSDAKAIIEGTADKDQKKRARNWSNSKKCAEKAKRRAEGSSMASNADITKYKNAGHGYA